MNPTQQMSQYAQVQNRGSNVLRTLVRLFSTTLAKKILMAVSGIILYGFMLGHMFGTLQVFAGKEVVNGYAITLRKFPVLLLLIRTVLISSALIHIVTAVQLARLKKAARPVSYARHRVLVSRLATRTMFWTGPVLAIFLLVHVLQFNYGFLVVGFEHLDAHGNMIDTFRSVPMSIAYVVGMLLLGYHVSHGGWSLFQSLGVGGRLHPALQNGARVVAVIVVLGYISMPLAVLFGILR